MWVNVSWYLLTNDYIFLFINLMNQIWNFKVTLLFTSFHKVKTAMWNVSWHLLQMNNLFIYQSYEFKTNVKSVNRKDLPAISSKFLCCREQKWWRHPWESRPEFEIPCPGWILLPIPGTPEVPGFPCSEDSSRNPSDPSIAEELGCLKFKIINILSKL